MNAELQKFFVKPNNLAPHYFPQIISFSLLGVFYEFHKGSIIVIMLTSCALVNTSKNVFIEMCLAIDQVFYQ